MPTTVRPERSPWALILDPGRSPAGPAGGVHDGGMRVDARRNREALLRAVAVHVLTAMGAEAEAALADESDPFAALTRYLRAALELRIAAVMPVLGIKVDLGHEEEVARARDAVTPLYERMVAA